MMSEKVPGEYGRLREAREDTAPWRKWGPYLTERQWGTVREDYSEDGLAGLCDEKQRLCFALALWNSADPILKERAFGLTNSEGNHGEDVKEYYFYLDATPTHSYGKYLYKYPQRAFPYDDLVRVNRARTRQDHEYELIDTGIFEGGRYFDIFAEHAKVSAEDILILLTVQNRGPEPAPLHLLPTLWFRNLWADQPGAEKPVLTADGGAIAARHPEFGAWRLECEGSPALPTTRPITGVCSAARTRAALSRTASTTSCCTGGPTRSIRRQPAPRPRRTTGWRLQPAARQACVCGCARAGGSRPSAQRGRARPSLSRALPPPGRAHRTAQQGG
jgi:hypothetical protein